MKSRHILIPAMTQVLPGAMHAAEIDCTSADGGSIVIRIANGPVGPTESAVATVLAAFDEVGAEWVRIARFDASTTAGAAPAWVTDIPRDAARVRVEVSGHAGAAVQCAARAVLRSV